MQKMESVLASVLPAGISSWTEYSDEESGDSAFIVEELPGKVYPTQPEGETAETVVAETMESAEEMTESADQEVSTEDMSVGADVQESSQQAETSQNLVGMGKEDGEGDAPEEKSVPVDYEAAKANGYKIYVIGEGETLYGICIENYGNLNHLAEVCRLNDLADVDKIFAGQKLILP